jgi:hypothetical protein
MADASLHATAGDVKSLRFTLFSAGGLFDELGLLLADASALLWIVATSDELDLASKRALRAASELVEVYSKKAYGDGEDCYNAYNASE